MRLKVWVYAILTIAHFFCAPVKLGQTQNANVAEAQKNLHRHVSRFDVRGGSLQAISS
ncbi:MAG: hypothetical protein KGJ66_05980 [Alphaproteobacteria bacterium]|nr:hypothetical protein [Alphaproteobacteria bacterium]